MYQNPRTRRENARQTKDFTKRLAAFAKLLGAEVESVLCSGNASEDDDAYIFEATIDGQTFNVEVFGPYYDEK